MCILQWKFPVKVRSEIPLIEFYELMFLSCRHELENHMKVAHNTSGKHKCLICDEIFPSPAVLAEHKLTHSKVGPSGKCSRCPTALPNVDAFRAHMIEHGPIEIPVQCICCRQTLNSDFEIGLHAK